MTISWKAPPANPFADSTAPGQIVKGLAYGAGVYVAVGSSGDVSSSVDGITWDWWEQRSGNFNDVAFGGGLFIGVKTAGGMDSSADGETWSTETSSFGTTPINRVWHDGSGKWVAVGNSGKVASSSDGSSWTQQTSGFGTDSIAGVGYGNSTWVIVGANGKLSTSSDGDTWSHQGDKFSSVNMRDVKYSSDLSQWVAIAGTVSSAGYHIYTASDPTGTWTQQTSPITNPDHWWRVLWAAGTWLIIGDSQWGYSTNGTSWALGTDVFDGQDYSALAYGTGWIMGDDLDEVVVEAGVVLQQRQMTDGSLIASVDLDEATSQVRRTPDGQHLFVGQGASTLERYSRAPTLEDTVSITDFFPCQDWNVDNSFYIYRLAGNELERYEPDGTPDWSVDLNAAKGYRFPSLMTIANGTGQQLVTGHGILRVVGYDGGADWTAGSEALLLTIRRTDGFIEAAQRFGGDSDDAAQAIALIAVGDCLYLCGAAEGTEFEGKALGARRGWLLRVPSQQT